MDGLSKIDFVDDGQLLVYRKRVTTWQRDVVPKSFFYKVKENLGKDSYKCHNKISMNPRSWRGKDAVSWNSPFAFIMTYVLSSSYQRKHKSETNIKTKQNLCIYYKGTPPYHHPQELTTKRTLTLFPGLLSQVGPPSPPHVPWVTQSSRSTLSSLPLPSSHFFNDSQDITAPHLWYQVIEFNVIQMFTAVLWKPYWNSTKKKSISIDSLRMTGEKNARVALATTPTILYFTRIMLCYFKFWNKWR